MTAETSNAREGVGRLVAVLDKAVAKLEVNWPNTAMDVREVRSALLNMAWEIEQHSEGSRTACNDRIALRSAATPPPAAARGDVRAPSYDALLLQPEARGVVGELVEVGDDESGQPRLLIHTTRDAIRAANLVPFSQVEVRNG